MNAEQRIKQIADEAIEKIKAIAAEAEAEKDEWPKFGDEYLYLTTLGEICRSTWKNDNYDTLRQACCRIAPNTDEDRAHLEKLAEWEVFFADFMTAGDAKPDEKAFFVECNFKSVALNLYTDCGGAVGQRGFTTEAKRDEWLNKWGRDYVEKMLKGGMP